MQSLMHSRARSSQGQRITDPMLAMPSACLAMIMSFSPHRQAAASMNRQRVWNIIGQAGVVLQLQIVA